MGPSALFSLEAALTNQCLCQLHLQSLGLGPRFGESMLAVAATSSLRSYPSPQSGKAVIHFWSPYFLGNEADGAIFHLPHLLSTFKIHILKKKKTTWKSSPDKADVLWVDPQTGASLPGPGSATQCRRLLHMKSGERPRLGPSSQSS